MILRARTSSSKSNASARDRAPPARRTRPRVRAYAAATAAARTSSCPPLSPPRVPLLFSVFRPPRRPRARRRERSTAARRASGPEGRFGTRSRRRLLRRSRRGAGRSVTPHPPRSSPRTRGGRVARARAGTPRTPRSRRVGSRRRRRTLASDRNPPRARDPNRRRRPRASSSSEGVARSFVFSSEGVPTSPPTSADGDRSTPPSLATERLIFSTFAIFADSVVVPDATTGGNEGATTNFAEDASNANLDPSTPIASKISSRTTRARQGETGAVSAGAIASPPRSARRRTSRSPRMASPECSPERSERSVASTFSPAESERRARDHDAVDVGDFASSPTERTTLGGVPRGPTAATPSGPAVSTTRATREGVGRTNVAEDFESLHSDDATPGVSVTSRISFAPRATRDASVDAAACPSGANTRSGDAKPASSASPGRDDGFVGVENDVDAGASPDDVLRREARAWRDPRGDDPRVRVRRIPR